MPSRIEKTEVLLLTIPISRVLVKWYGLPTIALLLGMSLLASVRLPTPTSRQFILSPEAWFNCLFSSLYILAFFSQRSDRATAHGLLASVFLLSAEMSKVGCNEILETTCDWALEALHANCWLGRLAVVVARSIDDITRGSLPLEETCLFSHMICFWISLALDTSPGLIEQLLPTLLLSIYITVIILHPLIKRKWYLPFYACALSVMLGPVRVLLSKCVQAEFVSWLVFTACSIALRLNIMAFWGAVLLVMALVLLLRPWLLEGPDHLNYRRKFFHFVITSMFVTTIKSDIFFVGICLCLVIPLFVLSEYLRVNSIPPLGSFLREGLEQFRDEKDLRGDLIVGHIFLIAGSALPVFFTVLASNPCYLQDVPIDAIGGVLCLGLGDSMASIIGKKFGQRQWPARRKTFEGTTAFVVSVILSSWILVHRRLYSLDHITFPVYCLCVLCTGAYLQIALSGY